MTLHLLARPRLLELMAARWNRRVVFVVAGPGFGKSVLLAQARAENSLAPRGVDVAVACTDADRAPAHLLGQIAAAAGVDRSVPATLTPEWVVAELAHRWPLGVCLMLDDVHHVAAEREGDRLLHRLVQSAPAPVHFVLASRTRVRGLATARVTGDVLEISHEQLMLSTPEATALADAHGVDPSVLSATGGWPAAASMAAAYGIAGAADYVFEAVLDRLDGDERRVLAIAAAIGGGDAALLRQATGPTSVDPAALLDRLPLVSRSERGEFAVHDLWHSILRDTIGGDELRPAIAAAVDALAERGEFDRAFRLGAVHGDWPRAAAVLTTCCRHGHIDVGRDVLAGWLDLLPRDRYHEPDGLLLRGLVGRVTDPFGHATAELLQRAVAAYRAAGNVAGEIAAGAELVYVLRNQGQADAIPQFIARVFELDAAGHHEAAGPAMVGRAFLAEATGDDRQMLELLRAIPAGSLSRDWQIVVTFREAIGHLILGDDLGMVEAATRCAQLAGNTTDRHVLALAHWCTGDPRPALADVDEIVADACRSTVDGVLLGSLATTVLATAGQIEAAATRLAFVERAAATGPLSVWLNGALVGVRALVAAATGDDDHARCVIEGALADAPLSEPSGWRMAIRWLPLAYVLVPATRAFLDGQPLGPLHERRVAVARAVVAARDGGALAPEDLAALTPGAVATSVPLPWAMALAGRLAADGVPQGQELAEELLELYGEPAKAALRAGATHPVKRLREGARRLLATIRTAPRHPVQVGVLGPLMLQVGSDERVHEHWNRERVRSLLLYLVLNGPVQRERIVDALWPHLEPGAADRNLRVTLTYLNQVLEPDRQNGEAPFFVRQTGATLALSHSPHLDVDLWAFEALLDEADDADHRGVPSVALERLEEALVRWRGPCLADIAYEDWAQAACRRLTARHVAAAVRAAELRLAGGHPSAAVNHALAALAVDEWSEPAYGVLIAAALQRGDSCAAARALAECEEMLAGLGLAPGPQTEMLRRRLYGTSARALSAIA